MKKQNRNSVFTMLTALTLILTFSCSDIYEQPGRYYADSSEEQGITRTDNDFIWKWILKEREGNLEPKIDDEVVMFASDGDAGAGHAGYLPLLLGKVTATGFLVPDYDIAFNVYFEGNINLYDLVWSVPGGTIVSGQGTPGVTVKYSTGGPKSINLRVSHPNLGTLSYTLPVTLATGNDLSPSGYHNEMIGSATFQWNGPTENGSQNPWTYTTPETSAYVQVAVSSNNTSLGARATFLEHPWGLISTGTRINVTYTYGPITETASVFMQNPEVNL